MAPAFLGMEVPGDGAWRPGALGDVGEERAPACPGGGGAQPCRKLQPAASPGLAQSWGHTGDLPRGVTFFKKANSRPNWVSRACQRGAGDPHHPLFPACSGFPPLPHLLSLACQVLFYIPSRPYSSTHQSSITCAEMGVEEAGDHPYPTDAACAALPASFLLRRASSCVWGSAVRGGGCTRTGGRGWSNTHGVPRDMAESQAGPRAGSAQLRFSSGVVLRVKDQRPRGSGVGEMERSSFERKPRHQDISSDP